MQPISKGAKNTIEYTLKLEQLLAYLWYTTLDVLSGTTLGVGAG